MDGTTRYYMAGAQLAGTNSDRRVRTALIPQEPTATIALPD